MIENMPVRMDLAVRRQSAPTVFVHGMWGDESQWLPWLKHDGEERKTLAIGLRNNLTEGTRHISLFTYRDILIRILEAGKGEKCDLVGHSVGGMVSLLVALERPDLVRSLSLLASDGLPVPLQLKFSRYLIQMLLETNFHLSQPHQDFVRAGLPIRFGWDSGLVARQVIGGRALIRKPACPVRVFAASDDQLIPVGVQRELARILGAKCQIYRGTHMFNCDPTIIPELAKDVFGWCDSN